MYGYVQWAGEYDSYGSTADEKQSVATIHRSFELEGNFLDTADVYGPFANERLIAKAIKGSREKYIIATKFGFEISDDENLTGEINGSKSYVKKSVERSLKNLGTDFIDLYYLHRLDTNRRNRRSNERIGKRGQSALHRSFRSWFRDHKKSTRNTPNYSNPK